MELRGPGHGAEGWCFTTKEATFYMINRSRGSPALSKFFTQAFDGVLVTDFWPAYNAVASAARQACMVHLFRELDKVGENAPLPCRCLNDTAWTAQWYSRGKWQLPS